MNQQFQGIPETIDQKLEFFNERKQQELHKRARILKFTQLKTKGYTFGLGRYPLEKQLETPGPGHYSTQQPEIPISYSMGVRLNQKVHKFQAPPLGTYEIKGLDKYGYYTNSKFKNACATLFSPLKNSNVKQPIVSPGPGDYELPGSINSKGKHFISNFKTNQGWALGKKSLSQRKPYY
ncbi:unnamed protein product [Paramecium pentaurelia]|uniref:Uncharacterized protein n=1 Tax=Paramecium pentaurelia TaxID=43138 RepID=A0A8S1T8C2_9CILI|nr:unnamed protein product [Paramecium pentaurelia]